MKTLSEPHKELRKIGRFLRNNWYGDFEEKISLTPNMDAKWKEKASKEQRTDLEESNV